MSNQWVKNKIINNCSLSLEIDFLKELITVYFFELGPNYFYTYNNFFPAVWLVMPIN